MDDATSLIRPTRTKRVLALAIHGSLAAGLIPAVVLLAPTTATPAPILVAALAALAVIADRHDVPLPSGIRFDALIALALMSLALAGPVATLAVVLSPMAVNALTGREPLARAGNLANLAAYSAYTLAGALLLSTLDEAPTAAGALPWLVAIGVALLLVNWLVGPAVYGPLWLGRPLRELVRMLVDALTPAAAMLALAAAAIVLTAHIGDLALAAFALVAILPQSALTFAARTRPVARLDRDAATRAYADALAVQLRLPRVARRHALALAAESASGAPVDYAMAMLHDRVTADAHLVHERWDGAGRPIGLSHEAIPLACRLLAVARAWSAVTARGTEELSHEDALARLQALAGSALDPGIVRAARAVVAEEPVSAAAPAPEPRLHALRVPSPLRRLLATPTP